MLAKKFRLPIDSFPDGAKVFYRGQYFTIKTAPNNLSYCRAGIIITKKTASAAVDRNRLRRKIFGLFRKTGFARRGSAKLASSASWRILTSQGGKDLLVLVKPAKLDAVKEEILLKELNLLLQKLENKNELVH